MPSVTITRDEAVQRWPVEKNPLFNALFTATSRSASSNTTNGFFPPISNWNFAIRDRQAVAIFWPVPTEPVKLMASTRESSSSTAPTSEPRPMTRLKTPLGKPARIRMSASAHADPGTSSAGFITTVLPKANAGANFQAGIAMGKFQGVIKPTTPTASRVTSTPTPGRTEGITSPPTRKASPAKNLKILPARATSPIASGSVLPSSRANRSPSSLRRARISVPAASSTSKRCWGVLWDQLPKAARAAPIASRAWAASAWAYSPTTSRVSEGLMLRETRAPSTHSPLIRFLNIVSFPLTHHARAFVVKFPAGNEVLHGSRVIP